MNDKYMEANKQLAKLFGHSTVEERHDIYGAYLVGNDGTLPDWTGDNAFAFALMVGHGCSPNKDTHNKVFWINGVATAIKNHESEEAAARYAIVQAVIAKLESGIKSPS